MIYEFILTRKAKGEITEAYNYYETAKPGLGQKFLEHLDTYFNKIKVSPEQFPQKRAPYREAVVISFLSSYYLKF